MTMQQDGWGMWRTRYDDIEKVKKVKLYFYCKSEKKNLPNKKYRTTKKK